MADVNSAPDVEYNDDGTKNPTYVPPKTENESEGTDTENKGTGEEKGKDDKGGEKEEVFNDTIDPTKPPEIPIRNSNLQHIIARKNNRIEKLQSKLKAGDAGYVPPEKEGENEGDNATEEETEKDLSPEASKAVESKVQRLIAPLMNKLSSDADKAEFEDLIKAEPEAAKFANHIKAYMSHDAYKNVSPAVIYHHLAWAAAQSIGAKRRKAADLEANKTRSGGRTITEEGKSGDLPSAQEINDMSDEDFDKLEAQVMSGKFIKK